VENSGSTQGIETKVSETQGIEQPQETTVESNPSQSITASMEMSSQSSFKIGEGSTEDLLKLMLMMGQGQNKEEKSSISIEQSMSMSMNSDSSSNESMMSSATPGSSSIGGMSGVENSGGTTSGTGTGV